MADFSALKQSIETYIKNNGNKEITGAILQNILLSMVTTMGDGAINGNTSDISDIKGDIQNINGDITNINGDITNINGDITDLNGDLSDEKNRAEGAEDTLQQNITAEKNRAKGAETTTILFSDGKLVFKNAAGTVLYQLSVDSFLSAITTRLNTGALYAGYATPSTTPAALTSQEVFYLATQAGTYTNFHFNGGDEPIVLTKDGIYFIVSGTDDDDWNAEPMLQLDDVPTASSNNAVKSGGVAEELALGAVYDVSAKNPTAGPNSDGKWESLSALLSDANLNTIIPTSVRKGGMSIKFVQSSDNKYIQARCMAQNFTTDVTQWQGVDEVPTPSSYNLLESDGAIRYVCKSINLQDTFELGNIENLSSNSWTYSNSTTRIRTKQNTYLKMKAGDILRCSDYANVKMYIGYKGDSTKGSQGWLRNDFIAQYDGEYVILATNIVEQEVTVESLGSKFIMLQALDEAAYHNIDSEPIYGSNNLVKSSGVHALTLVADTNSFKAEGGIRITINGDKAGRENAKCWFIENHNYKRVRGYLSVFKYDAYLAFYNSTTPSASSLIEKYGGDSTGSFAFDKEVPQNCKLIGLETRTDYDDRYFEIYAESLKGLEEEIYNNKNQVDDFYVCADQTYENEAGEISPNGNMSDPDEYCKRWLIKNNNFTKVVGRVVNYYNKYGYLAFYNSDTPSAESLISIKTGTFDSIQFIDETIPQNCKLIVVSTSTASLSAENPAWFRFYCKNLKDIIYIIPNVTQEATEGNNKDAISSNAAYMINKDEKDVEYTLDINRQAADMVIQLGSIYIGRNTNDPGCIRTRNYIDGRGGYDLILIRANDIKIRVTEYDKDKEYIKQTGYDYIDKITLNSNTKYIRLSANYEQRAGYDAETFSLDDYVEGDFGCILPSSKKIEEIKFNMGWDTNIVSLNEPLIMEQKLKLLSLNKSQLTLLHFSDIHDNKNCLQRIVDFRNAYSEYITDAIHTGDTPHNIFSTSMLNFWNSVTGSDNILMSTGNHDTRAQAGAAWSTADRESLYNTLLAPNITNWGVVHESTNLYYYKDYAEKSIRLIILDPYYDVVAQNTWLQGILAETLDENNAAYGYSVIIAEHNPFEHITPISTSFTDAGYLYFGKHITSAGEGARIRDFVVSVDTFQTNGGKFICWIAGHMHTDIVCTHEYYPNQLMVIVNCATNAQTDTSQYPYRTEGTKYQDSFNVYSFDTTNKTITAIKIGIGSDQYMRHQGSMCIRYDTKAVIWND